MRLDKQVAELRDAVRGAEPHGPRESGPVGKVDHVDVVDQQGRLRTLQEHMVPSAFVSLMAIPLNPNGKVDRRALAAMDIELSSELAYVAPRTETESRLVEMWTEVLKLTPEKIGVNDNFFELGGDSILSIQIISRANNAGLKLTARQVFQHQTIAGLASVAGTVHVEQA